MDKEKCCGSCKHFKNEDTNGKGWCEHYERAYRCSEVACKAHCLPNNGWTEITPDNVDEVKNLVEDRIVIGWLKDGQMNILSLNVFWVTLETIAQRGGFYYYVLPELKIE